MTWIPTLDRTEVPRNADALKDVRPLLARLVEAFTGASIARMLGVNNAMVTRWMTGAPISGEMTRRILDIHHVLSQAFQVFHPNDAMLWLVGSEPLLDGARPIDVLALRGSAPVIQALAAIAAGSYA